MYKLNPGDIIAISDNYKILDTDTKVYSFKHKKKIEVFTDDIFGDGYFDNHGKCFHEVIKD